METLSTLLLVRFGLVAGAVVLVAVVLFAVVLVLRRRGRLDDARARMEPLVRAAARAAVDRYATDRRAGTPSRSRDQDDRPGARP